MRQFILNHFGIEKLVLDPLGGAHIDDCIAEAAEMSLKHGWDVEFSHNDHLYRVRYDDLLSAVKEIK